MSRHSPNTMCGDAQYHESLGNSNPNHNDMWLYARQHDCPQEDRQYQGSASVWRRWSPALDWEREMVQLPWKTAWPFLRKSDMGVPRGSTILLLEIYPREIKTYVHAQIGT